MLFKSIRNLVLEEYMNKRKSIFVTILWVIGWVCFFPIPLTVLIVKSKMKTALKTILIVLLWGGLFAFGKYNEYHKTSEINENSSNISTQDTTELKLDIDNMQVSTTLLTTQTTVEITSTTTHTTTTSSSTKTTTHPTTTKSQEDTTTIYKETDTKPKELIIKGSPAVFDNFSPLDFNGVEVSIDKLKVCSDLSNPESSYNFYYIVMEYTVSNNTNCDCSWEIHQTGNIYGSFSFSGYDRSLGGNYNIKDEDISSPWGNKSVLAANEKVTYSMVLVIDREMDDPPKGLQLRQNSEMTISLPININGTNYNIAIDLNIE